MASTDFFDRFPQLNIAIIGDVMIDRYLEGDVDRISPEAPVPVVHLKSEDNRLGGAANVALNIAAMGATPLLFSVVGKDENGELLKRLLPQSGIANDHLLAVAQRQTTVKTRVLAQNQHLLRVDREDKNPLAPKEASALLDKLNKQLNSETIHLILFQDYNKGVLTPWLIDSIIGIAQEKGIPTAVDPKNKNFWAYKGVTLFKPNLREIQQQLEEQLSPELASMNFAAQYIQKRLNNTYTMITLSEKGLFLKSPDYTEIIPTQARSIADVCGAGDTVISVAALALALGLDLTTIAHLANLAGGQVCEKVGVVPVDKDQLRVEYEHLTNQG
ncbi:MAG: PfkB family carbohydrate kinase [Bacteroidota bacterium]